MKKLTLIALTFLGACNVTDLQSASMKQPTPEGCNTTSARLDPRLIEYAIYDSVHCVQISETACIWQQVNTHQRISVINANTLQDAVDLLKAQKLKVQTDDQTAAQMATATLPDNAYDVRVIEGQMNCYVDGEGILSCGDSGHFTVTFHTNDEANSFQDTCFKPVN